MDECSDDDDNYELSMRERDMDTLQQGHKNVPEHLLRRPDCCSQVGFKDGRDAGRNEAIQQGFEQGWPSGLAVGLLFGHLLGWLRHVHFGSHFCCLPLTGAAACSQKRVLRWCLPRSAQSCAHCLSGWGAVLRSLCETRYRSSCTEPPQL